MCRLLHPDTGSYESEGDARVRYWLRHPDILIARLTWRGYPGHRSGQRTAPIGSEADWNGCMARTSAHGMLLNWHFANWLPLDSGFVFWEIMEKEL
jgi:hypothetical protein